MYEALKHLGELLREKLDLFGRQPLIHRPQRRGFIQVSNPSVCGEEKKNERKKSGAQSTVSTASVCADISTPTKKK